MRSTHTHTHTTTGLFDAREQKRRELNEKKENMKVKRKNSLKRWTIDYENSEWCDYNNGLWAL